MIGHSTQSLCPIGESGESRRSAVRRDFVRDEGWQCGWSERSKMSQQIDTGHDADDSTVGLSDGEAPDAFGEHEPCRVFDFSRRAHGDGSDDGNVADSFVAVEFVPDVTAKGEMSPHIALGENTDQQFLFVGDEQVPNSVFCHQVNGCRQCVFGADGHDAGRHDLADETAGNRDCCASHGSKIERVKFRVSVSIECKRKLQDRFVKRRA